MSSRVELVTAEHDELPTVSANCAVWSVLAPSAVTVIWLVPFGVDADVAMVSVEEPPEEIVAGLNVAVAPAGRPEADSVIDCAAPEVIAVLIVVVAEAPGCTEPDAGFSATEKSGPPPLHEVGSPLTVVTETASQAALVAFDALRAQPATVFVLLTAAPG